MATEGNGPEKMILEEIDGELVILDTAADVVHQLNPTATFIWQRYSAGASIDEIVADLMARFDVRESDARRDAQEIIERFGELGIQPRSR